MTKRTGGPLGGPPQLPPLGELPAAKQGDPKTSAPSPVAPRNPDTADLLEAAQDGPPAPTNPFAKSEAPPPAPASSNPFLPGADIGPDELTPSEIARFTAIFSDTESAADGRAEKLQEAPSAVVASITEQSEFLGVMEEQLESLEGHLVGTAVVGAVHALRELQGELRAAESDLTKARAVLRGLTPTSSAAEARDALAAVQESLSARDDAAAAMLQGYTDVTSGITEDVLKLVDLVEVLSDVADVAASVSSVLGVIPGAGIVGVATYGKKTWDAHTAVKEAKSALADMRGAAADARADAVNAFEEKDYDGGMESLRLARMHDLRADGQGVRVRFAQIEMMNAATGVVASAGAAASGAAGPAAPAVVLATAAPAAASRLYKAAVVLPHHKLTPKIQTTRFKLQRTLTRRKTLTRRLSQLDIRGGHLAAVREGQERGFRTSQELHEDEMRSASDTTPLLEEAPSDAQMEAVDRKARKLSRQASDTSLKLEAVEARRGKLSRRLSDLTGMRTLTKEAHRASLGELESKLGFYSLVACNAEQVSASPALWSAVMNSQDPAAVRFREELSDAGIPASSPNQRAAARLRFQQALGAHADDTPEDPLTVGDTRLTESTGSQSIARAAFALACYTHLAAPVRDDEVQGFAHAAWVVEHDPDQFRNAYGSGEPERAITARLGPWLPEPSVETLDELGVLGADGQRLSEAMLLHEAARR